MAAAAVPPRSVIAEGLVLRDGQAKPERRDILIEGDRIAAIAAPGAIAAEDAVRIDASRRLIMPGLVNAHTHGHGGLAKGVGDRWSLDLLLNAAPWIGGRRGLEDKYLSALLSALEMLRKGCTACYDLFFEFPAPTMEGVAAVAQAYSDAGMRAVVAPMVADLSFYQSVPGLIEAFPEAQRRLAGQFVMGPADATVAALRGIARSWAFPSDRIRLALAPTIPLHCSDGFLAACRDLAREHGLAMQMHIAEARYQAVAAYRRYGRSLVAQVDALGLLGPRFSAAHGVWLDDEDLQRLADRGAAVAHNPGSNLRLGAGIAAPRAMLDRGIAVGIGTDGSASSDNQNMFEAMRFASFVSRVRGEPPARWLATGEALTLATAGSARVLGFDDQIGRIAPGCKADLVLLDLQHINLVPLNDAANQLVHVEDGSAVDSVMVGGRFVVEAGRHVGIDMERIRRQAERAVERLGALNAATRQLVDRLEPLVGRYCHDLSRCACPGLAAGPAGPWEP